MNLIIELPDDEVTALQARAERMGVSVEDYVRQVLEQDLKKHDKLRPNPKLRHISEVMAEIMTDMPSGDFAGLPKRNQ
jgi:plasmid stability protein